MLSSTTPLPLQVKQENPSSPRGSTPLPPQFGHVFVGPLTGLTPLPPQRLQVSLVPGWAPVPWQKAQLTYGLLVRMLPFPPQTGQDERHDNIPNGSFPLPSQKAHCTVTTSAVSVFFLVAMITSSASCFLKDYFCPSLFVFLFRYFAPFILFVTFLKVV